MMTKLFELGIVVATPSAVEHMTPDWAASVLNKHTTGDYGDIPAEDATLNDKAIHNGSRLISSYHAPDGEKIWVITEADRSVTTFLLPSEY